MKILGLDFETTFTDPIDTGKALIIETGFCIWDTATKVPLVFGTRIAWDEARQAAYDPRITELTGLTLEQLAFYGKEPRHVLAEVSQVMSEVEYVVAHNGSGFDLPVLRAEAARHGVGLPATPWLDTSTDVPYPKKIETRKLDFLAPSHGFLNPFAHRALFDVLSMLKVLSNYPIEEVIRRATSPKVTLRAVTKKPWDDAGKSNNLAKERGFRFNGEKKIWVKIVLADEVAAELAKEGLQVVVME